MQRNPDRLLAAIGIDIGCLIVAVFASSWLRLALPFGKYLPDVTQEIPLLIEALIIYPLVFLLVSLYDPDRKLQEWDEFLALVTACTIAGLALAGLIYFSIREISRLLLLYYYGLHFIFVSGWRLAAQRITKRDLSTKKRKVVLIGSGKLAQMVVLKLADLPIHPINLLGYIAEDGTGSQTLTELPCLGSIDKTLDVVRECDIDDVLIALDGESYAAHAQQVVTSLVETTCNVWLAPDYYSLILYGGKVQDWGGISLISLKVPALTGYQRLVKRSFDLVLSSILLICSLPIQILIALWIRLDSPGQVLLKQDRVGENRRIFEMYKFRTMVADAEGQASSVMRIDSYGHLLHKLPDDPRVTRMGRFLRRTSMDELPQLWNVLKGEMSLVGPRPELPRLVANYEPWQQKRFAVPQGMTGWWQVNGRSERPMHLHTEDDLYYIQNYSIFLDIQILLKTIWVVLFSRGAF